MKRRVWNTLSPYSSREKIPSEIIPIKTQYTTVPSTCKVLYTGRLSKAEPDY
jgi:hypothetical protein